MSNGSICIVYSISGSFDLTMISYLPYAPASTYISGLIPHSSSVPDRRIRNLTYPRIFPLSSDYMALSSPTFCQLKLLPKPNLNTQFQLAFLSLSLSLVVPISDFCLLIVLLYWSYDTYNSLKYIILIYHHLSLSVGHKLPEHRNHVTFVSAFPTHSSDSELHKADTQ